jgi:hypothetical protein
MFKSQFDVTGIADRSRARSAIQTHSTDLFKVPEMGCRLGLSKGIKETVDFMIDGFFVSANQPG